MPRPADIASRVNPSTDKYAGGWSIGWHMAAKNHSIGVKFAGALIYAVTRSSKRLSTGVAPTVLVTFRTTFPKRKEALLKEGAGKGAICIICECQHPYNPDIACMWPPCPSTLPRQTSTKVNALQ